MKSNINSLQVLGSGCPTCRKLHVIVSEVATELGVNTEVEYIDDIQKIIELGVMSSPVLVINQKVVLSGQIPDKDKIKKILNSYSS